MNTNIYDIIIIGGGPAGLTAGIYASRSKFNTLLIEKMGCGGKIIITDIIENYPGFPDGISGFELAARFEDHARKFGLVTVLEEVLEISNDSSSGIKTVVTQNGSYNALSLIISSGADHKKLNVPGEEEFLGKGVSYCATCDGPFFKDKEVIVVGGGDSSVQEALYLTKFAKNVKLIHRRDRLRATKILQERAFNNPIIELILSSSVTEIFGEQTVKGVTVKNLESNKESQISASGVFVFVGHVPNTEFAKNLLKLEESGYIITNEHMRTSVPGIFACGDARHKMLKQVATAVGEGAAAAFSAQEYVDELKGNAYK